MQQLKRAPILLIFSFITLFVGIIYTQGYVSLPLDMQSNGLGPQPYGAAIAVNGFLIILVTIPVSNMAAKWRRFESMALSGILLGLGFGVTAFAFTLPSYMVSVIIWTLGEIMGTSVAPAIIADLSPIELRGLYQGIFGSAWGLAYFLGPLAGGWVYDHFGSNALWGGCFALGLLIALGYLAMSKPAQKHMERSSLS